MTGQVHQALAARPAPPAVRVTELSLAFDGASDRVQALDRVSLDVAAGEHMCVIGPSGSGKSSLLAVLARQEAPTGGRVELVGRTARIHQDLRLVPRASALRNVLHGSLGRLSFSRSVRFPDAERTRAEALLARVGLGHRLHAPVRTLSGGEAQRVAIARALMQDPEILLADEPVASLDPENAAAIMALLDDLRRERSLTLISVLHDHDLAEAHADRIVEMRHGRIISEQRRGEAPRARDAGAAAGAATGAVPTGRKVPGWGLWLGGALALALSAGVLIAPDARNDNAAGAAFAFLARLVPTPSELSEVPWGDLVGSLVETLRMAVIGTALAVVVALPLSALAARNVAPRLVGMPVRAALNVWRAIPSIVWALLFVAAVGLGTIAGVYALTAYSVGYLTKFFYEA
ncbi:MAG: ATP-binding cassette domain-containing protein, partial [Thermaurantiacus sp.]